MSVIGTLLSLGIPFVARQLSKPVKAVVKHLPTSQGSRTLFVADGMSWLGVVGTVVINLSEIPGIEGLTGDFGLLILTALGVLFRALREITDSPVQEE